MRIVMSLAALSLMFAGSASQTRAEEKSHRAAAEELLKVAKTEKTLEAAIEQTLELQLKANPQLGQVKDVMKTFLTKHLGYAALKEDLISIYVSEFTESELKEMTAFYRTPTGKKAIEKLPALMQKGAELGMKRVQEHSGELKALIEEELQKKPTDR